MAISDWSSDVCSSDLTAGQGLADRRARHVAGAMHDAAGADTAGIAEQDAADAGIAKVDGQAAQATFEGEDFVEPSFRQTRDDGDAVANQIGRASCRERVCQYV